MLQSLTILAPGLLGGSVGRAARHWGAARRVTAWARRPETRLELRATDWCDAVADDPGGAVRDAELVVICAPVSVIPSLAAEVRPHLAPGAIVTDVGSVKGDLCRAIQHDYGTAAFVGSHPMAGNEKTGHAHGSAHLFEGRPCFVTPLAETSSAATERVVAFWRALQAEVVTLHPDAHDEIVAHISHLPHLVAATLCSFLGTRDPSWRNYAGPGLRDATRIAAGDPRLWRDILEQNRHEVLAALRRFQDELQHFQAALANGDFFEVLNILERGQDYRRRFRPDRPPPS